MIPSPGMSSRLLKLFLPGHPLPGLPCKVLSQMIDENRKKKNKEKKKTTQTTQNLLEIRPILFAGDEYREAKA